MLEVLGRLLFLHNDPCCRRRNKWRHISDDETEIIQLIQKHNQCSKSDTTSSSHMDEITTSPSSYPTPSSVCSMEQNMQKIERHLCHLVTFVSKMAAIHDGRKKDMGKHSHVTRQWKAIGQVLDRLFIVLYLICIVLSLWILFPVPPMEFLFGTKDSNDDIL